GGLSARPLTRSDVVGIDWPPILGGEAATVAALLRQLGDTEWMAPADIEAMQHRQLVNLATHCAKYSPHFQRRLKQAGLKPRDLASPSGFRRLPVMNRRQLQTATDLYCQMAPNSHMPLGELRSTGSTGEPVVVRRTTINRLMHHGFMLRQYLWHERDFTESACGLRASFSAVTRLDNWGPPASLLFDTGPYLGVPITFSLESQLELIAEFAPAVLSIHPNNLEGLARLCIARGVALPSVRHAYTLAETVKPELRAEVAEVFGADIIDCYSSQEGGCIALQCPQSGLYHVMAEGLIVEILDDLGKACAPGEIGGVTLTDLHNFAMPIVRYQLGDYAEASEPCPCGRGLPTLARIHGRDRNLILMPDGTRHWMSMGPERFRELAPILQFQFIQDGRESMEMRLLATRPLTAGEMSDLEANVQETLGYPFAVRFTVFEDEIPKGPSGKFEMFMCMVG
ncbi:MAG: phenylacetate--CoA ligase family protein, partial [Caulobacteraceae bacterium]